MQLIFHLSVEQFDRRSGFWEAILSAWCTVINEFTSVFTTFVNAFNTSRAHTAHTQFHYITESSHVSGHNIPNLHELNLCRVARRLRLLPTILFIILFCHRTITYTNVHGCLCGFVHVDDVVHDSRGNSFVQFSSAQLLFAFESIGSKVLNLKNHGLEQMSVLRAFHFDD